MNRLILIVTLVAGPAIAGTDGAPAQPSSRFEDLDAPDGDEGTRAAPDPAQLLARGNRNLAVRGPEVALPIFAEGVQWHPDDTALRAKLALCLVQTQQYDKAQEQVDAILTREPEHGEAHWIRALAHFESGALRASVAGFTAVLDRLEAGDAQIPRAHWYRATALERLLLDPALATDPATAGLTQAEVDQLLASYDAYVELDPGAVDWPEVARKAAWIRQNRPKPKVRRWVAVKPADPRGDRK